MIKIKAYTIIELLVVITIGSFIVAMSIVLLLNIGKMFQIGQSGINSQIELLDLRQALVDDIRQSKGEIVVNDRNIIIPMDEGSINYIAKNQVVERKISPGYVMNTFNVEVLGFSSNTENYFYCLTIKISNLVSEVNIYQQLSGNTYFNMHSYLKE